MHLGCDKRVRMAWRNVEVAQREMTEMNKLLDELIIQFPRTVQIRYSATSDRLDQQNRKNDFS